MITSVIFLLAIAFGAIVAMAQHPVMINVDGHITSEGIAGMAAPGKSNSHEILIDRAAKVNLCCYWDKGNILIKLIDPQGNVIDTTSNPDNFDIDFMVQKVPEDYSISCLALMGNYPTGIWILEISSDDPNAGEIAYSVGLYYEEPELNIQTLTDKEYPKTGEPITITTILHRNTRPVLDATVMAIIIEQMQVIDSLKLYDDGKHSDSLANDGRYAAEFQIPSLGGYYTVRIEARKKGDEAFEIIDLTAFMATANKSTIEGSVTEKAIDTNDDGLYDELILSVGFDIAQKDYYELQARLRDRNNKMIFNSRIDTVLSRGYQIVDFSFDGAKIYEHGIDAPYILKSLVLADTSEFTILLDYAENVYTTKEYSYRDFQHGAIVLTGNHIISELDIDGDGLYNSLMLEIEVDLLKEGYYKWQAQIRNDEHFKPIGFAASEGFVQSGLSNVQLSFSGADIRKSELDGPYTIWALTIYSKTDNCGHNNFRFETREYEYRDFE